MLAELDRRGVPVVIVTARPIRWMDDLWPLVGRHGLAIVSNGAAVVDVRARRRPPVRDVRGIERRGRARAGRGGPRGRARGVVRGRVRCPGLVRDPSYVEAERVPGRQPGRRRSRDLWTEPALKLLVKHDAPDPADFRDRVVAAVGEHAVATWTLDGLVEISATGVTKATALARWPRSSACRRPSVVAFGDMPNDLPMLSWAGTSYAMANGHPDVRAAADHVAPATTTTAWPGSWLASSTCDL